MCLLWPFSSTHAALLQILRLSLWNLRLSLSQKVETKSPQQPLPTPGLEFRSNFVWSRGKFHPSGSLRSCFLCFFCQCSDTCKVLLHSRTGAAPANSSTQSLPEFHLGMVLEISLVLQNCIQSCFPGHHWFHVCSGFKLVLSYRVLVCKLA